MVGCMCDYMRGDDSGSGGAFLSGKEAFLLLTMATGMETIASSVFFVERYY